MPYSALTSMPAADIFPLDAPTVPFTADIPQPGGWALKNRSKPMNGIVGIRKKNHFGAGIEGKLLPFINIFVRDAHYDQAARREDISGKDRVVDDLRAPTVR